jgi:nuclease S1
MRAAALLMVLVMAAGPAWGWGAAGHRTVARIAQVHLNNRAIAEIAKLLEENESIVSVSSWADEVRPKRKESAPWHYINIPVWTPKGDWAPYCPAEGCIARKVKELITYLKSGEGDRTLRAEALKYLVHFMGDLHQPMHVGDRKDRGGNDTPVVFFDKATNLHSIWDTAIVERMFEREPQLKTSVDSRMEMDQRKDWERGSVDDWVWEGQALAGTVAYRYLTSPSPAVIGSEYQAQAEAAAWGQLRKGGVRLARVLNEIWPD